MPDKLDDLAETLYGRPAAAREYVGGSDARILGDAAERIRMLTDALERAQRLLSVCEFDAPEDLEDYDIVFGATESQEEKA